jgi:predicted aspartyl protease
MEVIDNGQADDLQAFLFQQEYVAIPVRENIAGHLLVEVNVNGTSGIFILDTGAATTVADVTKAELLRLIHEKDDTTFSGAGAGGQGLEVCPSSGNTIQIGNFIRRDFMITLMSLQHVNESLAKLGADEEVTGIIGVDVFKSARAIIDYNKMMLYLSMKL